MKAYWDLKIAANSRDEVIRVIDDFESQTALITNGYSVDRYWKMPELYECRFSTEGLSDDPQTALNELRSACVKLGHPWEESPPQMCADGQIEYSSILDRRRSNVGIDGIQWAHCQLIPSHAFET